MNELEEARNSAERFRQSMYAVEEQSLNHLQRAEEAHRTLQDMHRTLIQHAIELKAEGRPLLFNTLEKVLSRFG